MPLKIPSVDAETYAKMHALLAAADDDLIALLKATGTDPKKDMSGALFANCNFGPVDVAEWDLRGTDLTNSDLSLVVNINRALFDRKTVLTGTRLPQGVTASDLVK